MATILVSEHNEDKTFGKTNKMKSILFNISPAKMNLEGLINNALSELENDTDSINLFAVCGRYLSYIELYKNKDSGIMLFFDNKNDDEAAFNNSNYLNAPDFRNHFMLEYERMKPFYEINYNAAELFLDDGA